MIDVTSTTAGTSTAVAIASSRRGRRERSSIGGSTQPGLSIHRDAAKEELSAALQANSSTSSLPHVPSTKSASRLLSSMNLGARRKGWGRRNTASGASTTSTTTATKSITRREKATRTRTHSDNHASGAATPDDRAALQPPPPPPLPPATCPLPMPSHKAKRRSSWGGGTSGQDNDRDSVASKSMPSGVLGRLCGFPQRDGGTGAPPATTQLFAVDRSGTVREWSEAAVTLTGFTAEEAIKRHFVTTFVPEACRSATQRLLLDNTMNAAAHFGLSGSNHSEPLLHATSALDGEEDDKLVTIELELICKHYGQNSNAVVLVEPVPLRDSRRGVVGVLAFVRETLDSSMGGKSYGSRSSKQSDRHNDKRSGVVAEGAGDDGLRFFLDSMYAPVFALSLDGRITEWNAAMADFVCLPRSKVLGKGFVASLVLQGSRAAFESAANAVLENDDDEVSSSAGGRPKTAVGIAVLVGGREGGGIRHMDVQITPRFGLHRRLMGLVCMSRPRELLVPTPAVVDAASVRSASTPSPMPMPESSLDVEEDDEEARHFIDDAATPVFGIDLYGDVNIWNRKMTDISGFRSEEAVGQEFLSKFVEARTRSSVEAAMERVLAPQNGNGEADVNDGMRARPPEVRSSTASFELTLLTTSDMTCNLLVNAAVRRGLDGQVLGMVCSAQVVGGSLRNDREVASIAHELRQLIESANAPIFGIDVDGNVNEWNRKTAEITGYPKSEALSMPLVSTFIVPRLRQSVQEVLDRALQGIETSNYELEFETKSKETRYLLVNATTRRDAENNIVGVVGVAQDVTDSTKNDRAMAAIARELRRLVDTANAPIFGIDVDGEVNLWNGKTEEITGFSKEEAFDNNLVQTFIVPSLRQSVQEVLDRALKGYETSNYPLEFKTKSNQVRHLLVNATTRRDDDNNIIGVVGVAQDVTEATRQSNAVVAMANELTKLIDKANAPIFGIDVNGNVNVWNDKTAEVTGFTKQEAQNQPLVSTFIVSSLQDSVQKILDDALCGQETANYELEFVTKNQQIRHLLVNATTRRDVNNAIVGVLGVAQDVTEATQRDRAATCMANELRQLIETANAPIFGIDVDGNVNEWNEKVALVTGFSKDQAMNRPLVPNFIVPELQRSVQRVLQNALKGRQTSNYALEFQTRYMETRHLLVNATTRRDADNNIVGVVGVAQDVTEELQHDKAVEAMANELRQLIDTANAPIFGVDVDGDVNEWNDNMSQLMGVTKDQAFDQHLLDRFIAPSARQRVQEVLEDALRGNGRTNCEFEFLTRNGESRFLMVNATTRRDADNNVVGVVGVSQDVTDAAEQERAIAAMARELRLLVDTANAPIFGIDFEGRVNEWNDKAAEITGYSCEEAFNKPFVEMFIVPKLRQSVQEVLDSALRGEGTSNYELEIHTKSNETRYLLVNATTRRDAENNIVGVVGVAQDVTETVKHARAVSAMANELRQLIDTANAPIFGIDVDGDVNEWNHKCVEITGFAREEAYDRPLVSTFIVPSLRKSVQKVLDNALQGHGTQNYELEFRTKSRETRYLLVNATTRRDAENTVVGVVGVAQDVTETVKREREVSAMANELRQLVDTANAPIFGIDVQGNVNEWNEKTAEITGYSKDEAYSRPLVSNFIAPEYRQKVEEVLANALEGRETANYELEFVTKSEEFRCLRVNATTRRDKDHRIIGVVGVAQDVTEDREKSEELRKMHSIQAAQQAKVETERNMTAYFAHELRNPLGAIDSALHAMPDDLPPAAQDLINAMQLCTSFMSSIMNNLLDVRKMEEKKMQLKTSPVSLKALAEGVHRMLLPSVREGVKFFPVFNVGDKDWVEADAHRIQQVLTNVVTNAIKYTESGSIKIIVGWEDDYVRFEIEDTGPGIPKSKQDKIFEKFVQVGGAPGAGLGLAIAKQIVDLTGGTIRFYSDPSVRRGTSCLIKMPLKPCDRPESLLEQVVTCKEITEKISFLIIDDVTMNRTMLLKRIKRCIAPNAVISQASTGEEALRICAKDKFDVIIVDQYMEEAGGVMVGTDVIFAMRRMRIDSVIIGCSGNDMDDSFSEAGSDWVWKKPLPTNAEILEHLINLLARRKEALGENVPNGEYI